jgi:hypothetical protein
VFSKIEVRIAQPHCRKLPQAFLPYRREFVE